MRIPLDWKPPERVDYEATVEKLTHYWSKIPSVQSIMLYGSVARGKYTPGRSDLDMALVFDADVVTNKDYLMEAARAVKEVTKEHHVELQTNCYDTSTLSDGRFSTVDGYFMMHLKDEGLITFGKDFRQEAAARRIFDSKEKSLGMRLRIGRVHLLEAPFHAAHNPDQFAHEVGACFEKAAETILEAVEYTTGYTSDYSKGGSLERFEQIFLTDASEVKRIISILGDYDTFDEVRRNPDKAIPLWISGLTFMENTIRELIQKTKGPAPITFSDL